MYNVLTLDSGNIKSVPYPDANTIESSRLDTLNSKNLALVYQASAQLSELNAKAALIALYNPKMFQGTWDASINQPALSSNMGIPTMGKYYLVNNGGARSVTGQLENFEIEDWVISNGIGWFRIAVNTGLGTIPILSKEFGTKLTGGSFDSIVGGQYKFNETAGVSDKKGTITKVYITVDSAGVVPLVIITSNGISSTLIKRLSSINVVAGYNEVAISETIDVGQALAFEGTSTVKVAFASSGLTGNKFTQGRTSTNIYGSSGSYYCLGFKVEYTETQAADIFAKRDYVDQKVSAIVPQKIVKVVRKNGTVGVDCDFSGNRGIQDAIESITDASLYKQYEVLVYEGVYQATQTTDYTAGGIVTGMVSFVRGKSFVSVRGVNRDRVRIIGILPNNLVSTTYQYYQTVYWHADYGTLDEVSIGGGNSRYPLHIDGGQLGCANFTSNILNVRIINYGNTGNATAWSSWHPLGLGVSDGQIINAKNSIFISKRWPFYTHNNLKFNKASALKYDNCRFECTDPNDAFSARIAAKIQSLGSGRRDVVEFNNCRFENCYKISHDDSPFIPSALSDQYVNHADYRITGQGNTPLLYEPALRGFALRVTSKSTGTTSTARFDPNSSAYAILIKDNKYAGDYTDDHNVNHGEYAYKDGYTGFSGWAIGKLDVGEEAVGLTADQYVKSLGKRLGDCSVTTKTLGIIIDGTTYSVVFNKNYVGAGLASTAQSDYNNTQILAEINAVITAVATADLWAVGNDYYPEFTDVMSRVRCSEIIAKGMCVSMDGIFVRKSLSTDSKIYGIALDNANSGEMLRVLIKGYIRTVETNRFSTLQETYVAIVKGDSLGVSPTAGKILKASTGTKFFTCFEDGILSFNL